MTDVLASRRLIPTPGPAPEDVVAGADGMLYCGLEDGRILRLDPDTEALTQVAKVPGRPLGLEALPDGRLLVCNSPNGLMRVDPVTGAVESLLAEIDGKRLIFASNVVAGRHGTVWFTASTMRYTQPQWRRDLIEAIPTGHLIRLDPDGRATVLADDLHFANGLVLSGDESHLIYAETAARRLSRWWLTGPKAGQSERMADLPGYPDNLGRGDDGMVWVAMPTRQNPMLEKLRVAPWPLRWLAARLPQALQPQPEPIAWVLGVDADGRIQHDLMWTDGAYGFVTGVCAHRGRLWCGSLSEPALLTCDLPG